VQASQLLFPGWHFLYIASAPSWTKRADELKAPADIFRPELLPQRSEANLHIRLAVVQRWLSLQVGGKDPAMQIAPGCFQFALALAGGYAWKAQAGRVLPDVVKNASASLVDAFAYALAHVTTTDRPIRA
jgi:hypothetical protein